MVSKLLIALAIFAAASINVLAATITPNEINQTLAYEYQKYINTPGGKPADYIPELGKVDPKLFSIVIATTNGKIYAVGDADTPFALESISKIFVYLLALQDNGEEVVTKKVGLNATGHSFNSIEALIEQPDHLQNPLVNAGAIVVTDLIKGKDSTEKWQRAFSFMQKISDSKLFLSVSIYESEMATNQRNRAIAELLHSYGMLDNPLDAVDRYTKACSVMTTAKQLAFMGAILANKGIHPVTKKALVPSRYVRDVLSEMAINGLYEKSGAWWFTVGLPAKSGVSGAIIAIVPGKMAIVVYSPPIDESGSSFRAQHVITDLSNKWKLHLLGGN